jgi:hypothetical protein
MDFCPPPFAYCDRGGRADADACAAAGAGIFVYFRKKGTADAWSETDRLFRTGVAARLAGGARFRQAGFGYGDRVTKPTRKVGAEHSFRASRSALPAECAFATREIEGWNGVNQ